MGSYDPQNLNGSPWDPNKTCSELPGYEKPKLEKKIHISPIETKLTEPYQSYGLHLEIGPKMREISIRKIVPGQIPLAGPLNYNLKQ